jgi:hypothetical protein
VTGSVGEVRLHVGEDGCLGDCLKWRAIAALDSETISGSGVLLPPEIVAKIRF